MNARPSFALAAALFTTSSLHAQVRRLLEGAASANPTALALTADGSHALCILDGFNEDTLVSVPLTRPEPVIQLATKVLSDSLRVSASGADVYYRRTSTDVRLLRQRADGSTPPVDVGAPLSWIHGFELSPDGSRIALLAWNRSSPSFVLYSASADGAGAPLRISADLPVQGSMAVPPRFSADGARVVFLVGADSSRLALYSAPSDGSAAPIRLQDSSATESVLAFPGPIVTSAGRVVYARTSTTGMQLWSAPIDGSQASIAIGAELALISGGSWQFAVSPDGAWAIYFARSTTPGPLEVLRTPTDGSAPAVSLLGPLVAGGEVSDSTPLTGLFTRDSRSVVLLADAEVDERFELWSARLDGSLPPVKLSMPLPDTGDVMDGCELTHDDPPRVVFRADAGRDELFELFSAPADGSATPVRLHRSLQAFDHRNVFEFELSHDRRSVLYVANEDSFLRRELHLVPSLGDRPARLLDRPGNVFEPAAQLTLYQERSGSIVFLRNLSGFVMRHLYGGRTTHVDAR